MSRYLITTWLALWLVGCGGDAQAQFLSACRSAGVCPQPAPQPMVADVLVDVSDASPTNAATVSEDAATVLTALVPRPESIARFWVLGEHLEGTALLHTVTVPTFRARTQAQRQVEQARFVAAERARITTLIAPHFTRPRPRSSPILEGLARLALADGYSRRRLLIGLTDGREVSSALSADWECARRLTTVSQLQTALRARRILEAGSLSQVDVYLARMSMPAIPGRDCPVGIARELHIRDLLRSALLAAGAARVEIESEGLVLQPTTRQEAH